jgi:predicted oxidoreductase
MSSAYPQTRERHGIQYTLLAEPDAGEARFTFSGKFQNQDVIWDATLLTLTRHRAGQPAPYSAFLEIGEQTAHGRAIRVVLDIPAVDEPAILRTIVMVRQYKRLRPGRHEFGAPPTGER